MATDIKYKEEGKITHDIKEILKNAQILQSDRIPRDPVIIIGPPKSGKSFFMEYLLGKKFKILIDEDGEEYHSFEDNELQREQQYEASHPFRIKDKFIEIQISGDGQSKNNVNWSSIIQSLFNRFPDGIRIIFLVALNDLLSERCRGWKTLFENLYSIYGSREDLEREKNSLMILISKTKQEKYDSLDSILNSYADSRFLRSRIQTFDLLDKPLIGGFTRGELDFEIAKMSRAKINKGYAALSEEMINKILLNLQEIKKCLEQMISVEEPDYEEIDILYGDLVLFKALKHPTINKEIDEYLKIFHKKVSKTFEHKIKLLITKNCFYQSWNILSDAENFQIGRTFEKTKMYNLIKTSWKEFYCTKMFYMLPMFFLFLGLLMKEQYIYSMFICVALSLGLKYIF